MSGTQSANRKESLPKKRPNQEIKRNNNRVSACLDIGWALPLPGRAAVRSTVAIINGLNDGGGARQNARSLSSLDRQREGKLHLQQPSYSMRPPSYCSSCTKR